MNQSISVSKAKKMISDKLSHFFGVSPDNATDEQYYKSIALIVRDEIAEKTVTSVMLLTDRIPKKCIISAWNSLWAVRLK